MQKKFLLPILFSLIMISILCEQGIILSIQRVRASPATIYVPDAYDTIQAAINAADPGDTIIVRPKIYSEHVLVNKTLTLIGRDRNATIIDGSGLGNVIHIVSSNVSIINFTIQNSGVEIDNSGILLSGDVNTTIRNNVIKNNLIGILFRRSNYTLLMDNIIHNNMESGVRLEASNFNDIIGNTLTNNTIGVRIQGSYNTFYHNNFIHNKYFQVRILGGVSNRWDNGAEGNYWSDYYGLDTNGDGIGDTDLLSLVDYKPLIEPWSMTRVFHVKSGENPITVESNCTIASFNFNHSLSQISFRITGPSGMTFFCNVSVPKSLLNAASPENWLVQLNNTDISARTTIIKNDHTSLYFTYNLSTYVVRIRVVGTGNFMPYVIGCGVAIAVIAITTLVILKKKKKHQMK